MNYLKRFFSSLVGQVGRDGGRVISNKVYKDRHAAPIRITGKREGVQKMHKPETENIAERGKIPSVGILHALGGFFPYAGPLLLLLSLISLAGLKTLPCVVDRGVKQLRMQVPLSDAEKLEKFKQIVITSALLIASLLLTIYVHSLLF
jgi:hypothetical protein